MATITISRQLGSAGSEIAGRVAAALGYEVVDKQLITEVARRANCSEEEVAKFDEQEETGIRAFLERLVTSTSVGDEGTIASYPWSMDFPYQMPLVFPPAPEEAEASEEVHFLDQQSCLRFVQATIRQLHQRGNVIIVGRAGMMLLGGLQRVLNVRLFASEEFRVERLMKIDKKSYREIRDLVRQSDRRRAAYVKRHYHVDWNNPSLYHLIINTEKTGEELAAGCIVEAVQLLETTAPPVEAAE